MGFSSVGSKKSSKGQQNSKMKDTVLPTQAIQSIKHQEKLKAKSCNSKPYDDLPYELKQHANAGIMVQQKATVNHQQLSVMVRVKKDDELVKYMSNLPGYLQRAEKTENIQDKALNVGVLDWSRLENWKYSKKDTQMRVGNNASLPCSNLSTRMTTRPPTFYSQAHDETLSCRKSSSRDDGISRDAKSVRDTTLFQDVANSTKSNFDGQKKALWSYKSFDGNSSNTNFEKGRRRELHNKITSKVQKGKFTYNGMLIGPKESVSACDREAKQRVEEKQEMYVKRKALEQKMTSGMGASSSKLKNFDISPTAKGKKNVDNSRMKKRMEVVQSTMDLPSQHQAEEKKKIVLLFPKKFAHSSFQEQPTSSSDENVMEANQNNLSDGFSDKFYSSELDCEIHHSCPLPSRAEINIEHQEMAPDAINTLDRELPSNATNGIKSSNGNLVETSKILDQDKAEVAARKGRHPSPNRRFSFSLGQMTRSFSFKESSTVPQLNSTYVSVKSGPVISKDSAGLDNSNREKASCYRARSSPLRRLLDPLLKSKGLTPNCSAAADQPFEGRLNSYRFKPINTTDSPQKEEGEASNIQAHLLLTMKNGLPLFRFMSNNNNIIVAAPMKNLMSTGKNDQGCNYALYTIEEIKKKNGSWISKVGKERSCGFVYNVVGQMKVNSSSSMGSSEQNSSTKYMVKESVLFGVERRQTGRVSPKLMPNTELAAVVVKIPIGNTGFDIDKQETDEEKNITGKGFSIMQESEQNNNCTVILPGGVHSLPNTGVPSPLIHRWRSGGSCDCGGWDVGCELRILSSEIKLQKIPRTSNACLTSNGFELFAQGEARDNPMFSMISIEKGKYSVEFSPSISLLQAVFICITVISCRKSSDLTEQGNMSKEKILKESRNTNDVMKIRTTVLGKTPVKYTPSPPVSPVGRV